MSEEKKNEALKNFESSLEEYKKILSDKILPKNQTASYDTNLKSTFQRMLSSAHSLEDFNPKAGMFGLIVLGLRAIIKLKDKNNELESRVLELERQSKRESKK